MPLQCVLDEIPRPSGREEDRMSPADQDHGDARELHIAEDLDFQRREWSLQYWGQGLMVAFVLAGLAGLFGGGPASRHHVQDASGQLELEHSRLARAQGRYFLRVSVAPQLVHNGSVAIWIDKALLDTLTLEQVAPRPEREVVAPQRVTYHFHVGDAGAPVPIAFDLQARTIGVAAGRVGVAGGPDVRLWHFLFP